jgi:pimeloyl-ACP methyl ester carboxylesterase
MEESTINWKSNDSARRGSYAPVNGLYLYYETYGDGGTPLIVLHGGLGGAGMFGPVLPALAETRRVVAVELQAHGHTADVDRPLSFEAMADDVAALIRRLGLAQVDLLGYSLGGGVALQAAIRHPDLVRKLVVVSAPVKRDGWYPEVLVGMAAMTAEAAQAMAGSPPHAAYVSAAPKPEDWPVLVAKTGDLLRQDYDWTGDFAALQAPVMIVVGDADSVRTAHALEMFALLGGGQHDAGWDGSGMPRGRLAILPGTTHYNIISPRIVPIVAQFLDAGVPKAE